MSDYTNLEQLQKELPIGIDSYLTDNQNSDKSDKFQCLEIVYHFPCCSCIHRTDLVDYCKDCKHYVN